MERYCMVTHGESKTKLNKVWRNMKDRSYNINNKRYPHYGGRGIKVCEEWQKYEPFRDWANESGYEVGLSLDRINNDGDYAPSNCRWATSKIQNNNFSRNRNISFQGIIHSISEWSRILKIPRNTLDYRINSGWSIESAFYTKPVIGNRLRPTIDAFQVREDGWHI